MGRLRPLALALALSLSACGAPAAPPPAAESPAPTPPAASVAESVPEPLPEKADFVLVTDVLPGIRVDLKYAGEDNFTGAAIYGFSDAYLRYGAAKKLAAAQAALAEQGYALLIWDAFRPTEAQFRLWDACPDPAYVANPETGFSSHSRGSAVDVTLVTAAGGPVEMPTGFDDFTALADRDYGDIDPVPAANARLLEDVMTECGFRPYRGEWWHFSDTEDFPVDEEFAP